MSERALVGNAADAGQVKAARKVERRERQEQLDDLRNALAHGHSRRVLWRIISHCRVFESIIGSSSEMTSYNAGQQDIGHYIVAELEEANPRAILQMMEENQQSETAARLTEKQKKGEGPADDAAS